MVFVVVRLYIGGSVFSLLCSVVLSKLLLHQNVERLGSEPHTHTHTHTHTELPSCLVNYFLD